MRCAAKAALCVAGDGLLATGEPKMQKRMPEGTMPWDWRRATSSAVESWPGAAAAGRRAWVTGVIVSLSTRESLPASPTQMDTIE
eukprot:CAMPEP_0185201520 /NCGR_PEP_ID=MMETSP1140-20130426/49360_1 /TAXON_ID=298111 /ORGANISM="Pavlova sp., Strain CCMP459" /LENGTH=84 /DNA_ID=CAMNT_0027768909 /DNA_START=28 /DNA_END=279 /DNA_ORIENTATION=-